jgi:ATP-dependent Clp protease adaptor protein ClpS
MSETIIETEVDIEAAIKQLLETPQSIVLYNDDVNTFDHVIECLISYCKHSLSQAEQCAMIVHYNGKCAVKTGSYDELKPICEALLENGLSAKIE